MLRRLITIPFSHYCEKARWALDRAGVSYVEEPHLPGLHMGPMRKAGGKTVPVLILADRALLAGDSAESWRTRTGTRPRRFQALPADPADGGRWRARRDPLQRAGLRQGRQRLLLLVSRHAGSAAPVARRRPPEPGALDRRSPFRVVLAVIHPGDSLRGTACERSGRRRRSKPAGTPSQSSAPGSAPDAGSWNGFTAANLTFASLAAVVAPKATPASAPSTLRTAPRRESWTKMRSQRAPVRTCSASTAREAARRGPAADSVPWSHRLSPAMRARTDRARVHLLK